MKVRARVKAPEYLPDWAKCCEKSLSTFYRQFDTDDLIAEDAHEFSDGICADCGARQPKTPDLNVVADGKEYKGISAELFDLDEGPMETA